MELIKHRICPDPPVKCSPANHIEYCRYLEKLRQDFLELYQNDIGPNAKSSDFEMQKIIGVGTIAVVLLAKYITPETIYPEDMPPDKYYAIKTMSKEKLVKLNLIRYAYTEKKTLSAIRFPFVIHMEYYFHNNTYIHFVLPLVSGGDLFNLLYKLHRFKESQSKFYAAQILLGLEYLHGCHLVYRDLKPENILIDERGYLKLADFACCKELKGKKTWTFCGTPEYIAPETILCKGYGFSIDWWAFGVLLFEINSGFSPFSGRNLLSTYQRIVACHYKCPGHFSLNLINLISHLLEPDITRRYGTLLNGTNDIKTHKWFKDIDWDDILNFRAKPPTLSESPKDTRRWNKYENISIKTLEDIDPVDLYAEDFKNF